MEFKVNETYVQRLIRDDIEAQSTLLPYLYDCKATIIGMDEHLIDVKLHVDVPRRATFGKDGYRVDGFARLIPIEFFGKECL